MTLVPTVTLGRTGIETSALAIGAWGFGNGGAPSARVRDDALVDLLRTAFDSGIRLLDSADAYDNEAYIGEVLAEVGRPDDLTIISKFGHGRGFTADQFIESAHATLANLRIDRIDLMMVHDPRNEEDMEVVLGPGGALEGLRTLQSEGLVRFVGVATGTLAPLMQAVDTGEFDCVEFPRLYTLLNRAADTSGLLASARAKGMATLAAAPFAGNILATGVTDQPLYCYRPALPEVVDAVSRMDAECDRFGVRLSAAALAFVLANPGVDAAVIGVTNAQELAWNLESIDPGIAPEALREIAAAGEIDEYLVGGPDFVLPFPAERSPGGPLL